MGEAPQPGVDKGPLLPVPGATIPYWRTQPHWVDEYRSSEQLPSECDIAIIGTGMAGVATAYHIAKLASGAKPSIVLLEARQVCSGATGRNGGHAKIKSTSIKHLIEKYGLEEAEEFVAFVFEQIYALKDAVETEGLDCEFELRRSYDVFCTSKEASDATAFFRDSVKAQRPWVRHVDLIDTEHVEQITSIKGARAALSLPACSFWPYKFVTQLLEGLLDATDFELHTWTPVSAITSDNETRQSLLRTPRGTLRAKQVVFATNAYTAGICDSYAGTIIPYKGTACHISPRPRPISPHLSQTYNIFYEHKGAAPCVDYLNPRPDGGIVVGGGKWMYEKKRDEWYGNWDDSKLLPGARAHFDGLMQRHFCGWQDSNAAVDHIWTGVQAATTDEVPHIGEVPGRVGQHYILAGFNGGGMALIYLGAQGLAKMILGQASFEETGLPRLFETSRERVV